MRLIIKWLTALVGRRATPADRSAELHHCGRARIPAETGRRNPPLVSGKGYKLTLVEALVISLMLVQIAIELAALSKR